MGCHFCFASCVVLVSQVVSPYWRHRESQLSVPHVVRLPLLAFFICTPLTPFLWWSSSPGHTKRKEKARATIVSSTNSLCPTLPCCHTASVSLPWGGGLKALLFLPSSVARIMMVLIIMFHDVCWASLLLEGGSIERQLPPSAQSHMPASTLFSVNDIPQHCPKNVDLFR